MVDWNWGWEEVVKGFFLLLVWVLLKGREIGLYCSAGCEIWFGFWLWDTGAGIGIEKERNATGRM